MEGSGEGWFLFYRISNIVTFVGEFKEMLARWFYPCD